MQTLVAKYCASLVITRPAFAWHIHSGLQPAPFNSHRPGAHLGRRLGPLPSTGASGRRACLLKVAFAPAPGRLQRRAAPRGRPRPLRGLPRIASRVGTHKPGTRCTSDDVRLTTLGHCPVGWTPPPAHAHRPGRCVLWVPTRFAWGAGALPPLRDRRPGGHLSLRDVAAQLRRFACGSPGPMAALLGQGAPPGAAARRLLCNLRLAPKHQLSPGALAPNFGAQACSLARSLIPWSS
jgi:hypothetical protein